jgi:hypothetical protein
MGIEPLGQTVDFFQKFWDVVGADVCKAMKNFFRSGKILRRINTTNIVLVPKKEGAASFEDFRPIALCTLQSLQDYK